MTRVALGLLWPTRVVLGLSGGGNVLMGGEAGSGWGWSQGIACGTRLRVQGPQG